MKLLTTFACPPKEIEDFVLRADNVLSNSGKELIQPSWIEQLEMMPMLVIRMEKVAKSVQTKYAHRYYSKGSLALSLRGSRMVDNYPKRMGEDFDGSFIRWEEWKLMDQLREMPIHIAISKGAKLEERDLPELTLPTAEEIAEAIAIVSKYYLLKIGDYIALPLTKHPTEISKGEGLFLLTNNDTELIYYTIS